VSFDLAAFCPRLALAHRQRRDELHQESLARRRAMAAVLRAEFAVAHYDLEVHRAGARGRGARRRGPRIDAAHANLDRARAALAVAQARAQELGAA